MASIGSVLSGFSRWSMLAWRGSGPDAAGPLPRLTRQALSAIPKARTTGR
jgi:hypothetical protein